MKKHFLCTILGAALLLTGMTDGASAQESGNDLVSAVVDTSANQVNGIGAQAGNGDRNTAVGIGAVVSGSSQNQVVGYGATAAGGSDNTAIGVGAVVVGQGSQNQTVGYGAQAGNGSFNTAIGSGASAIGYGQSAFGAGASALAVGSVALGYGSIADRPDTVSVGRSSSTGVEYDRQITNVAPGVYDTDAVNVSQLRNLDKKVNRVGATALAFSSLVPLYYDPKEPTQLAAGLGTYNGTGAIAIGVFHYTQPDVMLNAAVGMSNNGWEKAARFGITWRTGGSKRQEVVPTTEIIQNPGIVERVKRILAEEHQNGAS